MGSVCWLALGTGASAANVSWDQGASTDQWSDLDNWSPNGSPTDNDLSIGDLPAATEATTLVDTDFSIASLALSNGANAVTSGNLLTVNGNVDVSGAGSTLVISEHTNGASSPAAMAESISLNSSGALQLAGGRLVLDDPASGPANVATLVSSSGLVTGFGTILLDENLGGTTTTTLINDGTLQSSRPVGATPGERFMLTIDTSDADHRIDLDGVTGNGVVNVHEDTTLELKVEAETFAGTINLAAGAVLDLDLHKLLTDGATVNVDAGATGTATIRGQRIGGEATHTTPTTFNVNSGSFVHEEGFNLNSPSVMNMAANTSLVFQDLTFRSQSVSEIQGMLNINGPGAMILVENTTLKLNTPSFDWDGPEDVVTQVQSGHLYVQSNDISPSATDDSYDGTINLIDSVFHPEITNGWVLGGEMNLSSSSTLLPVTTITADETMTVDGGVINVISGINVLRTPTVFTSNASGGIHIDDGATLRVERDVTFDGGSTHTGAGTLEFRGATFTVGGNQAIAMQDGAVNLAADPTASEVWHLHARLSVQASEMDVFGSNTESVDDTIFVHGAAGQLLVDLADSDSWTLGESGILNVNGTTGFESSLIGDDMRIEGRVVVTDNTLFSARIDVAAGGTIDINTPGAALRLKGITAAGPNTISGGTIQGPGELQVQSSSGLSGHGTISTDMNLMGNADLLVTGGTLTVNGEVLAADQIIVDNDATLQLGTILDTSNLTYLNLTGGSVTGTGIANNNLLRGQGEIAVDTFVNNATLFAAGASDQTLVVSSATGVDLDGDSTSGEAHATSGNLTIASPLTDDFDGRMFVGSGRTLTLQNWWTLGSDGSVQLNSNGVDRASLLSGGTGAILNGTVEVSGIGQMDNVAFHSDATVELVSDLLELDGNSTIDADATFTGAGLLQNLATGSLSLDDNTSVGIRLDNHGELHLDGQATVHAFSQAATGNLNIDIENTSAFDQLTFANSSSLDGGLLLSIDSGYVPTLGDSFHILTGAGGLLGTFSTLASELPSPGAGLAWEFDYTGAEVVLRVIEGGLPGDFNGDGHVNLADYTVWRNNLGASDEGVLANNGDNSGTVDTGDYDLWKMHLGDSNAALAAETSRVPEPNTLLLATMLGCSLLLSARVSR
ncbi:beta strand repeat-containing protein [Aeoliella sp.]|uniref:beta strand repeat-containing protein n=1 Tax=Aeoliella sp. TaxID=2795800 RepID=UPI003CCBBD64